MSEPVTAPTLTPLAPVADALRRHGMQVLTDEYRALVQQGEQAPLNTEERGHLRKIEAALVELQAMGRPEYEAAPAPTDALCTICDAPLGECDHHLSRYLEPILYEPGFGDDGKRKGWKVPERERERWENPPRFSVLGTSSETPIALTDLIAQLEAVCDLHGALLTLLRETYEAEPLRVSRIAASVLEGAESGRVRNPGGLLRTRLSDLAGAS